MAFTDIYGQDRQVAMLQNAIRRERVPHAYLFHGMEGTGKRFTAKTFAKALNCKVEKDDACGRCGSCVKIERGNHPDITIIEPDGLFIKIKNIRDLQDRMKYRPFEGKTRVSIIVAAEAMNAPAANALLKTLEEPSKSNVLILITAHRHRIPQTILSRCQKIRFNPLHRDVIVSYLVKHHSLDREEALMLAASSGGSIGRALALHESSQGEFTKELIEGVASFDKKNLRDALVMAGRLADGKSAVTERLDILKRWYRDIMVYRETGDESRVMFRDVLTTTAGMADRMSGPDILQCLHAVDRAYRAIEQNANKQLTLESMMFKLTRI